MHDFHHPLCWQSVTLLLLVIILRKIYRALNMETCTSFPSAPTSFLSGRFAWPIINNIQYSGPFKALYSLLPWEMCSIKHRLNFCGKHPAMACATINVRRLLVQISTTVCSQVLIHTAGWTGAMLNEKTLPKVLRHRISNLGSLSQESEALSLCKYIWWEW